MPISGATTHELIMNGSDGSYHVEMSIRNDCPVESDTLFFEVITTINNLEKTIGLSVYPNPANNVLQVATKDNVFYNDVMIHLYDMAGRRIKSTDGPQRLSAAPVSIQVGNLPQGVYLLEVDLGGRSVSRLVSIQH